MIREINFYETEITVRINSIKTPFGHLDLEAIIPVQPEALRVPKVETAEDVLELVTLIEKIEKRNHIAHDKIKIHPMIETAVGVQNAFKIAAAHERITAITIGGQDLIADLGIGSSRDTEGIDYARKAIVMAAKASRVDALDTVFVDVDDDEGLRRETEYIKRLGFTGKAVINPRQIEIIHDVFSPTEEEIRKAFKIVKAFEEHRSKGIGVFALDGKMIDAPVVTRAQTVLELANIQIDFFENNEN